MSAISIVVEGHISQVCPAFVGAAIEAHVLNTPYNEDLWKEIQALCAACRQQFTTSDIKLLSGIAATRRFYKACGKDPSRYRPAAESLIRRAVQGKSLFQIDTLVDLINLASMKFGYSIGGFDADKFVGQTLTLGIGRKDEPYEGIGRGQLNIEGLPVYRDGLGGVGTPTSDHERTKITLQTTHVLVLVNGYDGNLKTVLDNAEYIQALLRKYGHSDGGVVTCYPL